MYTCFLFKRSYIYTMSIMCLYRLLQGNYNNVLEVHQRPPSISSKERLQLARWQAASVALETKMMAKLHS